jgi:hypothetical protein
MLPAIAVKILLDSTGFELSHNEMAVVNAAPPSAAIVFVAAVTRARCITAVRGPMTAVRRLMTAVRRLMTVAPRCALPVLRLRVLV